MTGIYRNLALKQSILDIPNERSSHSIPTPRGGGIAIVITFYLGIGYLYVINQIDKNLLFALLPGIIIAITGTIDDVKGLSPAIRIMIQIFCTGLALYFLNGIHADYNNNLHWIWFLVSLTGMIWFINLFNFMDGSDGYASMEAISILIILWYFTKMNLLLIPAIAVGGFLYWNWPKAKIFMGDSGSTTLGFILAVLGIYLHNSGFFEFTNWLLITSLFWFDATYTLYRRISNKEKLNKAHKNHMYQRAIRGGFSHLKTLTYGFIINILLFVICLAVIQNYLSSLTGILLSIIILWCIMQYVDHLYSYN